MSDEPKPTSSQPAGAGPLSSPLTLSGLPAWLVYVLSIAGLIYILNPTLGVFELLPDNLPFVGNLDEGVAFMLLWAGAARFLEGRKRKQASRAQPLPQLAATTAPPAEGTGLQGAKAGVGENKPPDAA